MKAIQLNPIGTPSGSTIGWDLGTYLHTHTSESCKDMFMSLDNGCEERGVHMDYSDLSKLAEMLSRVEGRADSLKRAWEGYLESYGSTSNVRWVPFNDVLIPGCSTRATAFKAGKTYDVNRMAGVEYVRDEDGDLWTVASLQVAGTLHQPDLGIAEYGTDVDGAAKFLLHKGRKIQAIKLYRACTGLGLLESKNAVEAM